MRFFSGRGAVIAAIALGVLTAYIAARFVDQAQSQQTVEMANVVVAAAPIGPRAVIRPDMVRIQRLPAAAVHPTAARSTSDVVGKVARLAMVNDEQVLMSKMFLQREESGLAFSVPDGMRAVSVGVSEVISSGGMIVPGDRVDVIGVFEMKLPATATTSATGSPTPVPPMTQRDDRSVQTTQTASNNELQSTYISTVVLEDVSVLAIAQRLEGEDSRDNTQKVMQSTTSSASEQQVRSNPQPAPAAKTATFAVSPEDALKLVLAEDRGKIRLALRRGGNSSADQQAQRQQIAPQVSMNALVAPRTGN